MARDYVADIRKQDRLKLLGMLDQISNGISIPHWPPGIAFEHVVIRALEIEGAMVTWPFKVKHGKNILEQFDGAIYSNGLACLVESKDYSDPINVEPIAKLRNQLARRPAGALGLVFSRSGFAEEAKILTRMMHPLNIFLWERGELERAIGTGTMCRTLMTKYMYAVEWGVPDYFVGIEEQLR